MKEIHDKNQLEKEARQLRKIIQERQKRLEQEKSINGAVKLVSGILSLTRREKKVIDLLQVI